MASNTAIVEEVIRNSTSEEIFKVDYNDFEQLKKAAKAYVDIVDVINQAYQLAIEEPILKKELQQMYELMRRNVTYTRLMLKYQLLFEGALNSFLNRKIYLTYVKDDGTLLFYGDANIGKLYEQAAANRGRGNLESTKMFDANDLEASIQKKINESIKDKQAVYARILARYRKNTYNRQARMHYKGAYKTFYWWRVYHNTLGGWTNRIENEGPIGEGYADAVINQDPQITSSKMESSIELFASKYLFKDNIPAAVKGDVVLKDNGSLQFAVKKGKFSTASVGQYIYFAENVLRLKNLTVDDLKNPAVFSQLTRTGRLVDRVIKAINEDTLKEIEKTLSFSEGIAIGININ